MRRLLLVLVCCSAAMFAVAQSTPPKADAPAAVEQEGRDGSSYSKAIIIIASNDTAGAGAGIGVDQSEVSRLSDGKAEHVLLQRQVL